MASTRLTHSRQSDVLELWSDRVINPPEDGQSMKVQATEIAVEEAGDDIGALAATANAEACDKKSDVVTIPKKAALAITSAAETDLISDLVHEIECLEKKDAIARLIELEDAHEQTYFEIGGLLAVMQIEKWFDPFASLDECVESKTAMKRSKARALIQIYNAIVEFQGRLGSSPGHRLDQVARDRSGLGQRQRAPS